MRRFVVQEFADGPLRTLGGLDPEHVADAFEDELTFLLLNQYGAFNSPVWFNVGLYHQYGVGKHSDRGNWHFDVKLGDKIVLSHGDGALEEVQLLAVFAGQQTEVAAAEAVAEFRFGGRERFRPEGVEEFRPGAVKAIVDSG